MIIIVVFVMLLYIFIYNSFYYFKRLVGYKNIEFFCCLIPIFIIILQIIPSLIILWKRNFFLGEEELTVKVTGHQWYWRYEYGDIQDLNFDSYIKSYDSFFLGDLNLLEVDNRLVLPVKVSVKLILTSSDVIHSWSLPLLFLKLDCIPGVLTVMNLFFDNVGLYYGQCSEICGSNHSFIPIVVEITTFNIFRSWILRKL